MILKKKYYNILNANYLNIGNKKFEIKYNNKNLIYLFNNFFKFVKVNILDFEMNEWVSNKEWYN